MPRLDEPLVCPVLVGREREIAELGRMADRLRDGDGAVVLVAGEAGIGKSRVLQALADEAGARGWMLHRASCHEQDRGLPFALLVDLVQRRVASDPATAAAFLAPAAQPLAWLMPEFSELLGVESLPARGDGEHERRQLFNGMIAAFARAAPEERTVLLLEDLHWADQGSLDFMAALARAAATLPVLVVATYRNDEVSDPLRQLLGALDRERIAAELLLAPLSPPEVEAMVAASLPAMTALRPEVLETLYRTTDGNPFYVEEVLRSALGESEAPGPLTAAQLAGARVPRSVQDALLRRLAGLSEESRELLTLAAIIGDRFELTLLGDVARTPEPQLLSMLRELTAQQLLLEGDEDQFRFRHALTREAVLRRLLARERQALHLQVANVIDTRLGEELESSAADLAYHLYEAAEWARVPPPARAAAVRAMTLYTPSSAAVQFARAIDASRQAGLAVPADLHLERARACSAMGDARAAEEELHAAITAATAADDGATLVDALLELGLLWAARDYQEAQPHLSRAIEVARTLNSPAALAHALNRVGNWHSNVGHYRESRELLDESLALLRRLGDPRAIGEAVDLLGMTCLQGGRFDESLTFLREAAEMFERVDDRTRVASTLSTIPVLSGTYQTSMLRPQLSLLEAAERGRAGLDAARQSGARGAIAYSLWQLSFCLGPLGEQTAALEAAAEALAIAEQIDHRQWAIGARCALGAAYVDLCQPQLAAPYLESARAEAAALHSPTWDAQTTDLVVRAGIAAGRPDEARAALTGAPHALVDRASPTLATYWILAAEAETALALADYDRTLEIVDNVFGPRAGPRMLRLRGRALLATEQTETAFGSLHAALEMAEANGDVSSAWRIHADLARLEHARDAREVAQDHAARMIAQVDRIADALADRAMAASFREHARLDLPPALRPRGPRASGDSPLSARELEVARLVAAGLTNRAIAERLVLSVRTVETHVAHATARLGFTTRSQLAAWVVEQRLLDGEADTSTAAEIT